MTLKYLIDWIDVDVEKNVLDEIKGKCKVVVIGGAGDLVLSLLANEKVETLYVVDKRQSQLNLIELKVELCSFVEDKTLVVDFLEGDVSLYTIEYMYNMIKGKLKNAEYWKMRKLGGGLLRYDVWRNIFSIVNNKSERITNKRLIEFFNKDFLRYRLGYDFNKIIPCEMRYEVYYGQIDKKKIIYEHDDIRLFLINNSKRKYDLICLGTIFDGWDENMIDKCFQLVSSRMWGSSRLIVRRFTGDIPLREIMNRYFQILDIGRSYLEDKTKLYKEVLVGCARGKKRGYDLGYD
jgi:Protein of unknown function (DUF3419)